MKQIVTRASMLIAVFVVGMFLFGSVQSAFAQNRHHHGSKFHHARYSKHHKHWNHHSKHHQNNMHHHRG